MNWILGLATKNPLVLVGIALAAFAAGGSAAWVVQGWRLDAVKAEYKGFVDVTRAEGEAAQAAADKTRADDQKKKETADAENKTALDRLRADNRRLRNARAGQSYLPAPAAGSASPERACFGRAELDRAIRDFDSGVSGLIDEGDEARVNLDTAKRWVMP